MAKGKAGQGQIKLPIKARASDRRASDRRQSAQLIDKKYDRRTGEDRRQRARREADKVKKIIEKQKQEQVRRRIVAAIKQKKAEKEQINLVKEEELFLKTKKKSKELIHYKKYQDEKKRLALSYALDYGLDPNTPIGQRLILWQQEVQKAKLNLYRAKKIQKAINKEKMSVPPLKK